MGGGKEECTLEGEIKQEYTSGGDWAETSFKRRPHFSWPSKKTHSLRAAGMLQFKCYAEGG